MEGSSKQVKAAIVSAAAWTSSGLILGLNPVLALGFAAVVLTVAAVGCLNK